MNIFEIIKAALLILELHKHGCSKKTVRLDKIGERTKVVLSSDNGIDMTEYYLDGPIWSQLSALEYIEYMTKDIRKNGYKLLPDGPGNIKCMPRK